MSLPVAPELMAIAFVVTFLSATIQGSIGFAFSLFSVSVLTFVDARLTPGPQLFLVLVIGLAVFSRERAAADWSGAAWILAGRFLGGIVGTTFLLILAEGTLNLLMASLILIAVVAIALRRPIPRTNPTRIGAGIFAEIMSTVSAVGGPPVALLYADEKGPVVRATLSVVFLVGICFSIGGRLIADKLSWLDLELALWLLPAAALGFWVSGPLTRRLSDDVLRLAILVVCSIAAIGILARSL